MNKIKLVLVGIIIILFVLPNLASAPVDEYEVVKDNMNQPKTLNDAVDEIKQMIKDNMPRWEIAKRVATIADVQITNMNEPLGESWSWKWFIAVPASLGGKLNENSCLWTEKDRKFFTWRDAPSQLGRGENAQYDLAANWVWKSRAGNCAEHAALTYYLLKEAGEEDIRIFTSARKDHQYVVWGLGCEKDPDNPKSWTEDVIIPDSWQHKVLRRQAVLNNEYCAVGEGNVNDQTYTRDKKACGFVRNKCCKKIAPCRGVPHRVCRDDECYICGREGDYCCKDERCNNEGLKCKDGKCVKKCEEEEEEVFPDCPPCVGSGSGLQLDAGNSSCTVNDDNFSVRCTYRGRSHDDITQDETFVDDVSSGSEDILNLSEAQDSLGNEQFVDRGHIDITTYDAQRSFSENYRKLSKSYVEDINSYAKKDTKGKELIVVHELEMLYSRKDRENLDPPSVYHVIVDGVFLYSERYYIEVNVEVFDSREVAVINTFDKLVECAKAVVDEREGVVP